MWDSFIVLLTNILSTLVSVVGDWGLAIILMTVIIRLLLAPLTIKSTKSSANMQVMQPKLQDIQTRYADDPVRMSEELRKLYSENKFNPIMGCLPTILQMPIFFALFTVLQRVPAEAHFFGILPSLSMSAQQALASNMPTAWVYILFVILFGVLTFIPMLLNMKTTPEEQRGQMKIMGAVMAVMMVFFGWGVAIGVVLYYVTSSAWGVVEQKLITSRILQKAREEEEERQRNLPPTVNVVRREKKKRPHKKSK